jgi:hypothetical protein
MRNPLGLVGFVSQLNHSKIKRIFYVQSSKKLACSTAYEFPDRHYLASDASSFTTGSAMLVDEGVSINRV